MSADPSTLARQIVADVLEYLSKRSDLRQPFLLIDQLDRSEMKSDLAARVQGLLDREPALPEDGRFLRVDLARFPEIGLIYNERVRQVEKEGWTPDHDAEHCVGELADAAACYLTHTRPGVTPPGWPWHSSWWKPTPDNRIRQLVKAGALVAAEIGRLYEPDARPLDAVGNDRATPEEPARHWLLFSTRYPDLGPVGCTTGQPTAQEAVRGAFPQKEWDEHRAESVDPAACPVCREAGDLPPTAPPEEPPPAIRPGRYRRAGGDGRLSPHAQGWWWHGDNGCGGFMAEKVVRAALANGALRPLEEPRG